MSSAARTNLSSQNVKVHYDEVIGRGSFRVAYAATYVGGTRNNQDAVAKCFHPKYKSIEKEFFASDFRVIDRAIDYAEEWNCFCQCEREIMMTKGDIMVRNGTKTLVEPLIRNFCKYTSNNGWISNDEDQDDIDAMTAFTHYTYHKSGGSLIVCDLQGRYRYDRYKSNRRRFELTDPAICSRRRLYGPTDLGEKGIESFFARHRCNKFCHANGEDWAIPRKTRKWFAGSSGTSMISDSATHLLNVNNRARFTSTLQPIYDNFNEDTDDESDDEVPMRF